MLSFFQRKLGTIPGTIVGYIPNLILLCHIQVPEYKTNRVE